MSQLRQVEGGQVFEFIKREINLELIIQWKVEEETAMKFCFIRKNFSYETPQEIN